ncbi:MAG: DUF2127 domain-containing protein [Fimbriimonas sp.]|nr:DUF2127 domain-containing protein [Fimbriimonas sp.]
MNRATDLLFRIGLIVKGVDSLFEVIGGVLLTMPMKLARYLLVLSQHELYRHHEVLSGRLDKLAEEVTVHVHLGSALYLLFHGLAKVILIAAIFMRRNWGFVGFMAVMSLFTAIELARAISAHEIVTAVLGMFDLLVVGLIYKEYRANKRIESGKA